jgi:hypothetical protein
MMPWGCRSQPTIAKEDDIATICSATCPSVIDGETNNGSPSISSLTNTSAMIYAPISLIFTKTIDCPGDFFSLFFGPWQKRTPDCRILLKFFPKRSIAEGEQIKRRRLAHAARAARMRVWNSGW